MNDEIFSGHIGRVAGWQCKTYMPLPYVWRKKKPESEITMKKLFVLGPF